MYCLIMTSELRDALMSMADIFDIDEIGLDDFETSESTENLHHAAGGSQRVGSGVRVTKTIVVTQSQLQADDDGFKASAKVGTPWLELRR